MPATDKETEKPILTLHYWGAGLERIKDEKALINSISESYNIAKNSAYTGGCGGCYDFIVELFTLKSLISLVATGLAWDIIKKLVYDTCISPLVRKIKEHKSSEILDIESMRIVFKDIEIKIKSYPNISIVKEIENIFKVIVENLKHMKVENGEYPEEIYIPICKDFDPANNQLVYREYEDCDDPTLVSAPPDYYSYYKLFYSQKGEYLIYSTQEKRIVYDYNIAT